MGKTVRGGRRIGWTDIVAIILVVGLYIILPFLIFLLVVAGYGLLSSLLRFSAWRRGIDIFYAFIWLCVAIIDSLAIYKLVKWYRS